MISLLSQLNLDPSILLSKLLSPRSYPIYFPGKVLGKGTFGEVYLVIDISIGKLYMAKKFKKGVEVKKEVKNYRYIKFRKKEEIIKSILYIRISYFTF
jgi:serine/threonine protein kinase